jgi:hypothetical protein
LIRPTVGFIKRRNFFPIGKNLNCTATYQIHKKELVMGIGTILIIILILLLVGGLPVFPHSRSWGYGPSGIIGTILVILLILVLLGRI